MTTTNTTTTSTLTTSTSFGDIYVTDAAGGAWHPSDEALEEIEASADPEAAAIRICTDAPMRGTWSN